MFRCIISDISDHKGFLFKNTRVYLVARGRNVEVAYTNKKKALRTAKNYGGDVYEGFVHRYLDKFNFIVNIIEKDFSYSEYLKLKEIKPTHRNKLIKIKSESPDLQIPIIV